MKLLISPHNDDETLFAAFTIMRERPVVLVVFDSEVQVLRGFADCDAVTRRNETMHAMAELTGAYDEHGNVARRFDDGPRKDGNTGQGAVSWPGQDIGVKVRFLGLSDRGSYSPRTIADAIKRTVTLEAFDTIYAPAFEEGGHEQHNQVHIAAALLVDELKTERLVEFTRYTTYVRGQGKTTTERPVAIADPEWIARKHRALACYRSQLRPELGCQPWFISDLAEYYL